LALATAAERSATTPPVLPAIGAREGLSGLDVAA
jgi:hypothetical protein